MKPDLSAIVARAGLAGQAPSEAAMQSAVDFLSPYALLGVLADGANAARMTVQLASWLDAFAARAGERDRFAVEALCAYVRETVVPELRELRPGGSMHDTLDAMARAALSPGAQGEEPRG